MKIKLCGQFEDQRDGRTTTTTHCSELVGDQDYAYLPLTLGCELSSLLDGIGAPRKNLSLAYEITDSIECGSSAPWIPGHDDALDAIYAACDALIAVFDNLDTPRLDSPPSPQAQATEAS